MNPQVLANEVINAAGMNVYQRREWLIYGSRHQTCPKCEAPAGSGCMDLSKRKRGIEAPVKNPHAERIDWKRVVDGLTERGYVAGARPPEPEPFESPLETMPDWAR